MTPSNSNVTPPPQRIGLLGGSFDPVHQAHLIMAQDALEHAHLDCVYFVPTAQSPFKHTGAFAPHEHRIAMLKLALANHPRFKLDLGDLEAGGTSYSVDTVCRCKMRHPQAKLFWILGADLLSTLPRWHAAESLANEVEFICLARPGHIFNASSLPSWILWHKVEAHSMNISSSEIRKRIAEGLSCELFLPSSVHHYICKYALYL